MDGPEGRVLRAFGLSEPAVRLAGGQGETWRSGAVVLKRADGESAWRADVLSVLPESEDFRVPRPGFIDTRHDPWADGDRVAWREQSIEGSRPYVELVGPLVDAWRPVELGAQVVHGDLPGNVMFAAGLPPAIIDWPVYWRPPAWAAAVAVGDALCWYGAEPGLAARWAHLPEWGQMLIRALIYRMATDDLAGGAATWTDARCSGYRPVIELALSYAD
jgi:hypothetical protein